MGTTKQRRIRAGEDDACAVGGTSIPEAGDLGAQFVDFQCSNQRSIIALDLEFVAFNGKRSRLYFFF